LVNAKFFILAVLLLASGVPLSAAQTLETTYRTNGPAVQAAFESVRGVLQTSSAVIKRGRDEIIYGTVISADGHILTKASELGETEGLTVTVGDKIYAEPVKLAEDIAWDVALLKIDARDLVPVSLALDLDDPARGSWVVANGATSRTRRRPQVGIISATAREIAPAGGPVLGVTLEEKSKKLVVTEIHEKSGAKSAGMKTGDRIIAAAGEAVSDREALGKVIEKMRVGDDLDLTVMRKGKKIELKVRLAGRADLFGEELTRNDSMSGDFSERRSGFARILQHDVIGNASTMGGPLLDLDGRCLGMNIARATRCETFAIPAADLKSLADRMISQAP
jgi:S1-C subfamily serine protease